MSEERFDRIEEVLGRIEGHIDRIDGRIDHIDGHIDRIDGRIDHIDSRIDHIEARVGRLETGQTELGVQITDVDRHMHVLHEDAVDRIRAVAEAFTLIDARMDRGFAEVKEAITRELDPLKAVVRHHSVEIDRLKKRRG